MSKLKVLGMKVSWMIGWSNLPDLHMLLEKEPPKAKRWRLIPVAGGNYLVWRQEPVVRFIFESNNGGGALGMTATLEDGSTHKTNGGWSSNSGAINRLRAIDKRFAEYLPHDVVDIVTYGEYARPGTYNDGWGMGIAGYCYDLPWVEKQIAEHLPGVELLDLNDRKPDSRIENQASAEQAAVIGGGSAAAAYGYIPVPADLEEITRESIKPDIDTELFLRTAMETDRKRVEQMKAAGR